MKQIYLITVITTIVFINPITPEKTNTCFCSKRASTPSNKKINDNYIIKEKGILHIKNTFSELVKRFNSLKFYENSDLRKKIEIETDIISENIFPVNSENNEKFINEINLSINGILVKISIRAIMNTNSILGGFWKISYEEISDLKNSGFYEKSYSRYFRNQFEVDLCRGFFIIVNKVLKNKLSKVNQIFDLMDQTNEKIDKNFAIFYSNKCIINKSFVKYSSITSFNLNGNIFGSKRKNRIKFQKNQNNKNMVFKNGFPKNVRLYKTRTNSEIRENFLSKKNMEIKIKLLNKDLESKIKKINDLKTNIALKNSSSSEDESSFSDQENSEFNLNSENNLKNTNITDLEKTSKSKEELFLKKDNLIEIEPRKHKVLQLSLSDEELQKNDDINNTRKQNLLLDNELFLKNNDQKTQSKINYQNFEKLNLQNKKFDNKNILINGKLKNQVLFIEKNKLEQKFKQKNNLQNNNFKNDQLKNNNLKLKNKNNFIYTNNSKLDKNEKKNIENNFDKNKIKFQFNKKFNANSKLINKKEISPKVFKIEENLKLIKIDNPYKINLNPKINLQKKKITQNIQSGIKNKKTIKISKNPKIPKNDPKIKKKKVKNSISSSEEELLNKLTTGINLKLKNTLKLNKRQNQGINFTNGFYNKNFNYKEKLIKLEKMEDLENMMEDSDLSEEVEEVLRTKLNFENEIAIDLTRDFENNFFLPEQLNLEDSGENDFLEVPEQLRVEESEEENLERVSLLNGFDIIKNFVENKNLNFEIENNLDLKIGVKKVFSDSEEDSNDNESSIDDLEVFKNDFHFVNDKKFKIELDLEEVLNTEVIEDNLHKLYRQVSNGQNSGNNLENIFTEKSTKSRIEEVTIINHDVFLKEIERNEIELLGKLQNKNFKKPEIKEAENSIIKIENKLQPENLLEMLLEEELEKNFINHEIEKLIISKKREKTLKPQKKIINQEKPIIDEVEIFINSLLDEIFTTKFLEPNLNSEITDKIFSEVICIFQIKDQKLNIIETQNNQCGYEEIDFGIEEPIAEKKNLFNKIITFFHDQKFLKILKEKKNFESTIFIYKNYQIEANNSEIRNLIFEDLKLNLPIISRTFNFVSKNKEVKLFISVGDEIYDEIAEFYLELFEINGKKDFGKEEFLRFRGDERFSGVFEHFRKVPMKFLAEVENRTDLKMVKLI